MLSRVMKTETNLIALTIHGRRSQSRKCVIVCFVPRKTVTSHFKHIYAIRCIGFCVKLGQKGGYVHVILMLILSLHFKRSQTLGWIIFQSEMHLFTVS